MTATDKGRGRIIPLGLGIPPGLFAPDGGLDLGSWTAWNPTRGVSFTIHGALQYSGCRNRLHDCSIWRMFIDDALGLWITDRHRSRSNSTNIYRPYHLDTPWRLHNFKFRFRVSFSVCWSSDIWMVVFPSLRRESFNWWPKGLHSHNSFVQILGPYPLVVSFRRCATRLNLKSMFLSSHIFDTLESSQFHNVF